MSRGLAPAVLLALAAAPDAGANVYETYGFDPRATARGGAAAAAADDYTAIFYNPAALAVPKQVKMGLGLSVTVPDLYVDRGRPDAEIPTVLREPGTSWSLGWMYPLGGVFHDRVAVAVSLTVPSGEVARVQGFDPRAPQFYMYQNLSDKLLFHAALAWEPFDGVSIGVGAQALSDLTGRAGLELDLVDRRFDRREFSVELEPTLSPLAGLHVRPSPGLSLGLTWRSRNDLSFRLPVHVTEGDLLTLDLEVSQTVLFTPTSWTFGLAYDLPDLDVAMSVDATYAFWSEAPDPSPRIVGDVGGKLLAGLGLEEAIDLSQGTTPAALGFVDTVTPRVGFEWTVRPWLQLRTGYAYRPTPVPRQTGTTAYLDNDAHLVSAGAGFTFMDPLRVHVHPVSVDASVQASLLPRRTVLRAGPSDPIGDLSHGGVVWSFGLAIRHAY